MDAKFGTHSAHSYGFIPDFARPVMALAGLPLDIMALVISLRLHPEAVVTPSGWC